MLPIYFAYISVFTSIFSGFFYLRDTLKGKTKPNIASWFIWFLAPVIAGFLLLAKGYGIASLPIFMAGLTPFLVCIFSFWNKNAYWKMSRLDYICLVLSLFAIAFWLLIKNEYIATIFAILADAIAFIPTYIKSWKAPTTEHLAPYFSGSFNAFLSFSTISTVSFISIGFAVYLLFGNLIEIVIVLARKKYLNIYEK